MALLKNISASPLTDTELLDSIRQEGSQEAVAELFLRYSDLVYGTCLKFLEDQELAKDAVMDIYQELLTKLKAHEVENFKGWLYVLTRNHCLMKLRKNKQMPVRSLDTAVVQSEDFLHLEKVLEKEAQLSQLNKCIEQLHDEQKRSVQLFYLENKCYNEIVEITGLEWNRVRSLIQNGRRNLKICMEKDG
ncbi:sigma-70 family RNA polymerase sigma factor [Segetibacter sp. 3557_3]|uniref:RNA polymerase sigma factor n=1 Tax=Segetibacter sp. 3557_3 TaxID=2547429 RepID=UPI00105888CB|nr:sigma-70 family RNA polymerase sigma factor [Segetibacter sp. 3557_3]TDH25624.1 sigma-70 family RNA polymerase sigma factor [Segetibacter sp. 3557_3]